MDSKQDAAGVDYLRRSLNSFFFGFTSTVTEPQIPTSDQIVWRYMEDWKFANLLSPLSGRHQPGQMWFSYPYSFDDDDEGTLPTPNTVPEEYCDRMAELLGLNDEEAEAHKVRFLNADTQTVRDCITALAGLCGVSCWHDNSDINSGMWEFLNGQPGVAIKSSVETFEKALSECPGTSIKRRGDLASTCVAYVDYSQYFIQFDGYRNILAFVERGWSHEKELRFVLRTDDVKASLIDPVVRSQPATSEERQEYFQGVLTSANERYRTMRRNDPKGLNIPLKLDGLMQSVVVSPGAGSAYLDTVCRLMEAAGLNANIVSEA